MTDAWSMIGSYPGDGVESCYSCSSVTQAIRARTGNCQVEGLLGSQDPDGLVLSARWMVEQTALEHLGTDPQYQCEPLRSFLCGEAAPGTVYTIRVT